MCLVVLMAGSWCTAPRMSLGYSSFGHIYRSEMFRSIHMHNLKVFDTCGQIALKMAPVYTPRQSSSAMGDPRASHNRLQRNRWYHLCPPSLHLADASSCPGLPSRPCTLPLPASGLLLGQLSFLCGLFPTTFKHAVSCTLKEKNFLCLSLG